MIWDAIAPIMVSLQWYWYIPSSISVQLLQSQIPKKCLWLVLNIFADMVATKTHDEVITSVYQLCLALWWSLIPGCLWLLAFVLNNTLILGIWCSTIPHLPGCFYPWTFFQNIGFNMVPSDPFMSRLATQLGYSAGEFQALQLIVPATLGVVD